MNLRKNQLPIIVVISISCLLFCFCGAQSTQKIDFQDLTKADYSLEKILVENESVDWDRLNPHDELKQLEGMSVIIDGYVVVVDPDSNFFVLAPEPILDFWDALDNNNAIVRELLQLKAIEDLSEYDPVTRYEFKGVLRLNTTDPNQMSLILEDAKPTSKPAVLEALSIEFSDLSEVKFAIKTEPISGMEYEVAKFSESIQKLNGKTISIEGYFQTIDDETFILTDTIYNTLVNCGHLIVGKEKIIALECKKDLSSYEENSKQTFTGWLELNASDPYKFTYILHVKK